MSSDATTSLPNIQEHPSWFGGVSKKTMTEDKDPLRSFHLFPYLQEDIKTFVLSFVADAPFETMPENYPKSSLTHRLPLVSKKFRELAKSDSYWKAAIERQVRREPTMWRNALHSMRETNPEECKEESIAQLVQLTHQKLNGVSYKSIYEDIVTNYLRFKGPVFYMSGQVQLGEPYALHFFEPRYRLLIAEVMREQTEEARNGGRIRSRGASFIHANRAPLAPTTPATIVQVLSCQMYPDGRADVWLLPTAYCWLERVWIRPNSGHLYYAQCLRMGTKVTNEMNQLTRQEALASVMDLLANQFRFGHEEDMLDHPDDGADMFDNTDTTDEE